MFLERLQNQHGPFVGDPANDLSNQSLEFWGYLIASHGITFLLVSMELLSAYFPIVRDHHTIGIRENKYANEWNTILITGGGSGIGRGLAEAFHALGNQVIIAGRRQQLLQETTAANPGMKSVVFDIENPDAIRSFAVQTAKDYPALNAVIHNAGIMRPEDVKNA